MSGPTADAYDAACAALHKHRARADKAEAELADVRERMEEYRREWDSACYRERSTFAELVERRIEVQERTAELAEARAERDRLTAELRSRLFSILQEIGGTVEGRPPGTHNYLQRLRELVAAEAAAEKLRGALRGLVEEWRGQAAVAAGQEAYGDGIDAGLTIAATDLERALSGAPPLTCVFCGVAGGAKHFPACPAVCEVCDGTGTYEGKPCFECGTSPPASAGDNLDATGAGPSQGESRPQTVAADGQAGPVASSSKPEPGAPPVCLCPWCEHYRRQAASAAKEKP